MIKTSLVALLVANVVPLVGVLFFGWSAAGVLAIYWLETLAIGAFTVLRILASQGGDGPPKPLLIPFFIVHFGIFMLVHGMFLVVLLDIDGGVVGSPLDMVDTLVQTVVGKTSALLGLGALGVSHGVSFFVNFLGAGEFRAARPARVMFMPYARVIVMHLSVLFGGVATIYFGEPTALLVLLVVVKTTVDALAHRREHRILSAP